MKVDTDEASSRYLLERTRSDLVDAIARFARTDGDHATAIPALTLYRRSAPTEPVGGLFESGLAVIAQGAKRVVLGDEAYIYDGSHYLLTSIDLPVVAQVIEANSDSPYLGLILKLDPRAIGQLMIDSALPPPKSPSSGRGIAISMLSPQLLQAVLRLVTLLDEAQDIAVLAPLIEREILYRLLTGEQGGRLRQIGMAGSQIAGAIDWIKLNYARPLRVDELADRFNMGVSTFHHHFRELTSMSPLQFQKYLRLQETRRLMLADRLDAATAAIQVGYESASQFSREYRRLFGAPPARDIAKLRESARNT